MPRVVLWLTLKKVGVEACLVRSVQSMNQKSRSCVRADGTFSDDFLVKVGSH